MSKPVVIYTTQVCPYCVRAKALLSRKGILFEERDVSNNEAERKALAERTGWKTVPQIFIGDAFVGGCDDLYALDAEGKLDSLLGAA